MATFVDFYHSTCDYLQDDVDASRRDRNVVCGAVGLKKVWVCAVPVADDRRSCCAHGPRSYQVPRDGLRGLSYDWRSYRTKNWKGYRVAGSTPGHVFYNFFLVPEEVQLKQPQESQLVRADLQDNDPVQLVWNDGECYIYEPDETDTTTTSEAGAVKHFHVAIVAPAGSLPVEDGDTVEEDEDTMSTTTSAPDSDTTSATTSVPPAASASDDTTTTVVEQIVDSLGIDCTTSAGAATCMFEDTFHEVVGGQRPWKDVAAPVRRLLRTRILQSVGTSRNALQHPEKRLASQEHFDAALEIALREAGQSPVLGFRDLTAWHRASMPDLENRGELRTAQARCGTRYFVPAAQLHDAMIEYVHCVNTEVMCREDISAYAKAAWCCYHLIRIHPFSDGNGRVARLVAIWALRRGGFNLLVQLSGPGLLRQQFIAAIKAADSAEGDVSALSEFVREQCEVAAELV